MVCFDVKLLKPTLLLLCYVGKLMLRIYRFQLKNMNIRLYRPFVYYIMCFSKKKIKSWLFRYIIYVE